MQTKDQEKIREELEGITKELVQVNDQIEKQQKKIDRTPAKYGPKLKVMCSELDGLTAKKTTLEAQHKNLVNLLNIIS